MTCERIQELMVEALYGELDAVRAAEFEQHVAGCANCAALLEEMRATASMMSERRRPDPGEDYWEQYFGRLEARMDGEHPALDGRSSAARRRTYVSWGYRVAAAVAVLIAGVWIGRSTIPRHNAVPDTHVVAGNSQTDSVATPANAQPEAPRVATTQPERHDPIDGPVSGEAPEQSSGQPGNVVAAAADVRAREYIERSQVLLLALVNAGPDTTAGAFGVQRERAGALVREAAVLRDDLPGSQNRRLRELVTDLQMILREIANLESENDLEAVQIIRNRVSREDVLLQIDVQQMRDENGETEPRTGGAID